jgi:hypothetical protein
MGPIGDINFMGHDHWQVISATAAHLPPLHVRPSPAARSMAAMSASDRPKWWPIVNEHVLDDRPQRLVVLGPIIEDRPPVEPDHVRHLHRRAFRTERQADALGQAEQIEFALRVHRDRPPGQRIGCKISHRCFLCEGGFLAKPAAISRPKLTFDPVHRSRKKPTSENLFTAIVCC